MKSHVINYIQYHGDNTNSILNSPLSVEGIGFDLESEYINSSKSAVYSHCPAWKHRNNRIFTAKSPVDINIIIDSERKYITSNNLSQENFNLYFSPTFIFGDQWCTTEKTTIQLTIPRFLFWTKSKNIWIEQKSHPLTSLNNNIVSVGGWFNLSNWTRSISFAFDVVDVSKPVIIKRGDPLFQISFYSKNFDDGFILKKSEPSDDIIIKTKRLESVVDTFGKKLPQSIKNKLFQTQTSKCPFRFLSK